MALLLDNQNHARMCGAFDNQKAALLKVADYQNVTYCDAVKLQPANFSWLLIIKLKNGARFLRYPHNFQ